MHIKLIQRCSLLVLLAFLASCAHAPTPIPAPEEVQPAPREKTFRAVTTWYGPGFNGKRTASGQVYRMNGMTAAHRTLPFGTRLRVTNPKNGRSVVVVVNDRGPFVKGRDLDLSRGAAHASGATSMCECEVEVLNRDMSYVKEVQTGNIGRTGSYWVQVGAFEDKESADHLREALGLERKDVKIIEVSSEGKTLYRVRIGTFTDRKVAYTAAKQLADEGYPTWLVRE